MSPEKKTWRIKEMLDWSSDYLRARKFESPRLDAEWLLAHALGVRRIDLYLSFDRALEKSETDRFKGFLKERLKRKPLQYIVGECEFLGLPLKITEGVLIPRPETEQLVEKAINILRSRKKSTGSVLDVCCGSGNIAISLAHFVPGLSITGVDSSKEALDIAAHNTGINELSGSISFQRLDVMSQQLPGGGYDLVISNPPYIPDAYVPALQPEVKNWEPVEALAGGIQGLDFISTIEEKSMEVLNPGGLLLTEIGGEEQKTAVENLLVSGGYVDVSVENDYNSVPRFASGRKPAAGGG